LRFALMGLAMTEGLPVGGHPVEKELAQVFEAGERLMGCTAAFQMRPEAESVMASLR